MTKLSKAFLLCVFGFGFGMPAYAVDEALLKHPVPEVAAFYTQNADKVDSLLTALTSPDQKVRLTTFHVLAEEFPEAAEIAARTLVTDANTNLAMAAIGLLKQNLVMSNHQVDHHKTSHSMPPRLQYLLMSHEAGRAALRSVLVDQRPELRNAVASFLASQSDLDAFDLIERGVNEGLYSDVQAANYFSLATGSKGQKYMEPFLGKGSEDAQKVAIEYLGFYPEYQAKIRNAYFSNVEADPKLRAKAADVLSQFDPSYPEYGLLVLSPKADPELFSAAVKGWVAAKSEKGTLDPGAANVLDLQIQGYLKENLGKNGDLAKDLGQLQDRLKSISRSDL